MKTRIINDYNKMQRGITLVALIITVIILLILAGTAISISINGGDIFGKTSDAREQWNNAVELEDSSLKDSLYALDMAANPDLAKSRLTVRVNGDTVESPYYVNYPSAKGTIKCRVLYNDSTYGLQLISAAAVTKVTLGQDDPNENVEGEMGSIERAQNSYNRIVTTLNEKAEEYIETENGDILAIDARCVGSDPLNKNYPDNLIGIERETAMFIADSADTYMEAYNGKLFNTNTNNAVDVLRMKRIGADSYSDSSCGSWYWIARRVAYYSSYEDFEGYCFCPYLKHRTNNSTARWGFLRVDTNGVMSSAGSSYGFRPVFIIADNVKIIGGEGTEEVPFELGL